LLSQRRRAEAAGLRKGTQQWSYTGSAYTYQLQDNAVVLQLVSARTSGVRPTRRYREQQTMEGAAVHSLLFAGVLTILLHGWFGLSRGLMWDK